MSGSPYVVSPDGRVFEPVATEEGYSIFVHTFGADATTGGSTAALTGGM